MSGVQGVWYESIASPVGEVFIAASAAGVCRVSYAVSHEEWLRELEREFGQAVCERTEVLAAVVGQLVGCFEGSRRVFGVPLDLGGLTPFQRQVLRVVERIPWGS